MLELPFGAGAFDAVIEKGTMDVLFVDNDSPWEPRPEVCARVKRMLDETHRCACLLSSCCPASRLCYSRRCRIVIFFDVASLIPLWMSLV